MFNDHYVTVLIIFENQWLYLTKVPNFKVLYIAFLYEYFVCDQIPCFTPKFIIK